MKIRCFFANFYDEDGDDISQISNIEVVLENSYYVEGSDEQLSPSYLEVDDIHGLRGLIGDFEVEVVDVEVIDPQSFICFDKTSDGDLVQLYFDDFYCMEM